jgi:hypothetical protein
MKHWIVLLGLFLSGCAASKQGAAPDPPERGWVGRDLLRTPPYHSFSEGLDTSTVEDLFLPLIRVSYGGERVIVVFGAWCGDSRREVPRFLKLADAAGIPADSVNLYAVGRSKKSDDGLTERWKIERVPTFIVEKNGVEAGRIVETPKTSMAADFLEILARAGK